MRDPDLPDPPPVKQAVGTARFESVNTPADDAGPPPMDVHEMLRLNLEHEKSVGLHELKPLPPRRFRRRRDYWLPLRWQSRPRSRRRLVRPRCRHAVRLRHRYMGIFTAATIWIMWFVMGDY